ncbi:MAG TPA: hypothetical protein VNJ12_11200 [Candidatus Dormibacteraeota bacterium]|nr:hypothetical protein [Candidatus Dormibacteraeota bacterium]
MKDGGKHPFLSRLWQALFLLWLLGVNILFYLQFRALAASRLPHWLSRWHL